MHQCEVGLPDAAGGEHLAELAVNLVVLGDDDGAAGLLIQAMNDAGAQLAAGGGELLHVVQQRVDQRAAVSEIVRCAGAGVDHHAGGLVDHGEGVVLIKDVERDVLRRGAQRGWAGLAFDGDGLAAAQLVAGLGGDAVDAHLAGGDEHLHPRAAERGNGVCEVGVEALAGGGGIGGVGAGDRCGSRLMVLNLDIFFENELRLGSFCTRCFEFCDALLLGSAGGAVLPTHGLAALALRQHVLRRHRAGREGRCSLEEKTRG